jgi:hypothetical protein
MRVAILLAFCITAWPQTIDFKPFEMVWRADAGVEADMSFLLDAPAGRYGFVRVEGGHLVRGDGQRLRLWGVNLPMQSNRPAKQDAAAYAAHLARFGVNCVRIHHFDWPAPTGIIDARKHTSRTFDAEQLDRFDYFFAELKKHGIYVDLNLNVGRRFEKDDGVPEYELLGFAKAVTLFDKHIIELEKEYARMLLGHRNPYTNTEYRNDPAVAVIEIVNENSIVHHWISGKLSGKGLTPGTEATWADIPPSYERDLTARFNTWLAVRLSPADLAKVRAEAGVAAGAPVPRLSPPQFHTASALRFQTEAAFYEDLETRFFLDMSDYLKNTLGVKAPLIGSSAHAGSSPYGVLTSLSRLDIVDGHFYWQNSKPGKLPDGRPKEFANSAMVNDPEHSSVVTLSRSAVAGKPFFVTEINHVFPNEYASEGMPVVAAYAAFLDWDAVFWYEFEHSAPSEWRPSKPGRLDLRQEPVRMSQLAAGAMLFERGDVAPAKTTVSRSYTRTEVNESLRLPRAQAPYFTPGFPTLLPLLHGSRIASFDGGPAASYPAVPSEPVVSDTNQLSWRKGLVTVDTDRSQALIGYVKAHPQATANLTADVRNEFCAIVVGSLDGKPIRDASRLLLTAGARVAATGLKWNEAHTVILNGGGAPVTIEPVTGSVTLRDLRGAAGVELVALDGAGRPSGTPVAATKMGAGWRLKIGEPATPWYLVRVKR